VGVERTAPRRGRQRRRPLPARPRPALAAPRLDGTVELVVEGNGVRPERRFRLIAADGRIEISEREGEARPGAVVTGSQTAWVRALGPNGTSDELAFEGSRSLADAMLAGFTGAAAGRAAA
jgi:hypothetical protein